MKQIPCIKQYWYVLGQRLKTILSMTNNLTNMIFNDSSYFGRSDQAFNKCDFERHVVVKKNTFIHKLQTPKKFSNEKD